MLCVCVHGCMFLLPDVWSFKFTAVWGVGNLLFKVSICCKLPLTRKIPSVIAVVVVVVVVGCGWLCQWYHFPLFPRFDLLSSLLPPLFFFLPLTLF